jgi:c-di-GMP-binding flagellar brake protein YcgR
MVAPVTDRRRHPRSELRDSLRLTHQPTHRQWPGRALDVSRGGMKIALPAAAPVREGHEVTLSLPKVSSEQFAKLAEHELAARVVRVDRSSLLCEGYVAVGVEFA